jgi:hypothetical protein
MIYQSLRRLVFRKGMGQKAAFIAEKRTQKAPPNAKKRTKKLSQKNT